MFPRHSSLKIQALIQKGIEEGATLVTGGVGRPEGLETGYYVKPTVFAQRHQRHDDRPRGDLRPGASRSSATTDEDEAVEIANDTPYGLSGYVSSSDPERARAVARKLRTGMVHLNGAPLDNKAPFGGYKQSGNGREFGAHGLKEFLEVKSIFGDNPKS